MYTRVRTGAILKKLALVNMSQDELIKYINGSSNIDELEKTDYDLISMMMGFNDVVNKASMGYPHNICSFLQNLCDTINATYTSNRCFKFDSDNKIISSNLSRLALYLCIKKILDKGFELLGIQPIDEL
jgi:arginyl-tRNA synthetase